MKRDNKPAVFILHLERSTVVRSGLVNMIPILIIGAFALIFKTFPVAVYQRAITGFASGSLLKIFDLVYGATFGVLSVYMTIFISRAYMKIKADDLAVHGGATAAALISFFILAGVHLSDFGTENTGPKSIFLAILTALAASAIYHALQRSFRRKSRSIFSRGADREFSRILSTLLPITLVALIFGLFNALIIFIFRWIRSTFCSSRPSILCSPGEPQFHKRFFFVLLSSLLWFFGIHGSDTLAGVMQKYFAPGLAKTRLP